MTSSQLLPHFFFCLSVYLTSHVHPCECMWDHTAVYSNSVKAVLIESHLSSYSDFLFLIFLTFPQSRPNLRKMSSYVIKEKTGWRSRNFVGPLWRHPVVLNLTDLCFTAPDWLFRESCWFLVSFQAIVGKLLVISLQSTAECVADCFLVPLHQFCHFLLSQLTLPLRQISLCIFLAVS